MGNETHAHKRIISFRTRGNNKLVRYPLTAHDWLVLLRAIRCEGSPQDAVAWTLMQRFAFLYPVHQTLHDFISSYAQSINPLWFPGGASHIEWSAKLKAFRDIAALEAEKHEAVRRLKNAACALAFISSQCIDIASDMFASGKPSPIPGSVHYCKPPLQTDNRALAEAARAKFAASKHMLDSIRIGDPTIDNWFFGVTGSSKPEITLSVNSLTVAERRQRAL